MAWMLQWAAVQHPFAYSGEQRAMKTKILVPALVLSAAAAVPATSMAEVSANIGWASEYIFRGTFQDDSSAYAGIDYAADSGFYLGTWGADVGDGLETDLYFGFAGGDNFTYKIGFTGYYYTDDFDQKYEEVNLGVGYGIFALDVAVGEYDSSPVAQDYLFTSITIAPEKGPYYKFGSFSEDFDGDYFELGYTYSMEDMGVDLSVAATFSDDLQVTDSADDGFGGESGEWGLVFGIKKSIGIGE
jgi:Bacterial protein of unknown function (Gcw_chp)